MTVITEPVSIEDLPEEGEELTDDQLLPVVGGLPCQCGSSKTWAVEWGYDSDTDF